MLRRGSGGIFKQAKRIESILRSMMTTRTIPYSMYGNRRVEEGAMHTAGDGQFA